MISCLICCVLSRLKSLYLGCIKLYSKQFNSCFSCFCAYRCIFGAFVVIVFGLLSLKTFSQDNQHDVRVLIDISGSMKRNDPNNLRIPAVELLTKLLPKNSDAGIWIFGKDIQTIVNHASVDESWRSEAIKKASDINSSGLYTNIGEALEQASKIEYSDAQTTASEGDSRSIILLTDGMVDIDRNPEKNQQEWRRIVDEILPKLQQDNFVIHTIALSENADTNLLNKLSAATNGLAGVAYTAEDLLSLFVKTFDAAIPVDKVEFDGKTFLIDSSIEEFTALIFKSKTVGLPPSKTESNTHEKVKKLRLIGPDNSVYHAKTNASDLNWYADKDYDLITIQQPFEGQWKIDGNVDSSSRVTIVSNLNLSVNSLPRHITRGSHVELELSLREDGKLITRTDFLSLINVGAELWFVPEKSMSSIDADEENFSKQLIWEKIISKKGSVNSVFNEQLPKLLDKGEYKLKVFVDGKSFTRSFSHDFILRDEFTIAIDSVFKAGQQVQQLEVSTLRTDVDYGSTKIEATLISPTTKKYKVVLNPSGVDSWIADLDPKTDGLYRVLINVDVKTRTGESIKKSLEEESFFYSKEDGFVLKRKKIKPALLNETNEKNKQDENNINKEQENEKLESNKEVEPDSQGMSKWLLYGLIAVVNIFIFVGGFFVFKKLFGSKKVKVSKDNEESPKQVETIDNDQQKLTEEAVMLDEDEEPPMEDLSPDEVAVADMGDIDLSFGVDEDMAETEMNEISNASGDSDLDLESILTDDGSDPKENGKLASDSSVEYSEEKSSDIKDSKEDDKETEEPKKKEATEQSKLPDVDLSDVDLTDDTLDEAINSIVDELDSDKK